MIDAGNFNEIKKHVSLTQCEEMAEIMLPVLKQHGITVFNYYRLYFDGSVIRFSTDRLWTKNYFQKDYLNQLTIPLSYLSKPMEKMKISDCLNQDPSTVLAVVHRKIPFSGYAVCHLGLCSASLQAIGIGMQAIRMGRIKAAVVGGVSGKVTPINLARLELLDAICTDLQINPQERSRPFDKRRSGFVLAEGAVLFFIEKLSEAMKRQGHGLLALYGYGSSLAAQHIVTPHTGSLEMKLSMQRALEDAHVNATKIDLINAHGTATVLNDVYEAQAIVQLFGPASKQVKVTANKSLHGHLIAAAGAMEILNTLINVNENFIPGTLNLNDQDSRCPLRVIKQTLQAETPLVLKNSFGMGGLAASMVVGKIL